MPLLVDPTVDPPSPNVRAEIVEVFWREGIPVNLASYDAYFRHCYYDEIQKFHIQSGRPRHRDISALPDHKDIILLARHLSRHGELHKEALQTSVHDELFPQASMDVISQVIELVLRLWLMMNVRTSLKIQTPGTPSIPWRDNACLFEFVKHQFPAASETVAGNTTLQSPDFAFEVTLTAPNLVKYSGVNIEWTACLADHLRYDRGRRILRLFKY